MTAQHGRYRVLVSDNGMKPTTNAILRWQEERRVERDYIPRDKPMLNGFVDSFNGPLRECLHEYLFNSLRPA